jgi:hypothetical protein
MCIFFYNAVADPGGFRRGWGGSTTSLVFKGDFNITLGFQNGVPFLKYFIFTLFCQNFLTEGNPVTPI